MKILIAEDEQAIADQYKIILESLGHEVIITNDGENCLKEYQKDIENQNKKDANQLSEVEKIQAPYDVVILDFRMPGKDGLQVAKEIIAICPDQKVIMATAYAEETITQAIKRLERSIDVLQKPFDLDVFGSIVTDS